MFQLPSGAHVPGEKTLGGAGSRSAGAAPAQTRSRTFSQERGAGPSALSSRCVIWENRGGKGLSDLTQIIF